MEPLVLQSTRAIALGCVFFWGAVTNPSHVAAEPAVLHAARVICCRAADDAPDAVVTGVAMTPDGRTVAAATDDHRVLVWDAVTGELKTTFEGHADWVRSLAFSHDGQILASGAADRCLCLWHVQDKRRLIELPACQGAIAAVSFHPNNQQVAVVGFSKGLWIVNTSTAQVNQQLVCPCSDVRTVAFSRDGARMAVAGRNGKIRVWNVNSGAQEYTVETDGRRIRGLAFSPDGRTLAAAGMGQDIHLFDAVNGQTKWTLATRPAKVFTLVFLNDQRLATGGSDNRIVVWDLDSRQAVTQLVGHTGTIAALCGNAAGDVLVSGSYDTTLRIWNLSDSASPSVARGPTEVTR